MLARALDAWWAELGRPDPYVVVEAGAGVGTLAAGVREAAPACREALRYVLVERSPALRVRQTRHVALDPPSSALGAFPTGDDEPDRPAGSGPVFTALADLPAQRFVGVVVANELLDNLPVRILERKAGTWMEVRVGEREGRLEEVLVPAAPGLAAEADRFAPGVPDGGRLPLQHAARSWLQAALARVERGRVVVVDYASTTPCLAARPWPEWLRTYRGHARGDHPLDAPGHQDVTCDVAVDQLAAVRQPSSDRAQAEFLVAHGLEGLVDAARAAWRQRAHVGDLEALRARSRVHEAAALTDPTGMGGFRVLEWALAVGSSA